MDKHHITQNHCVLTKLRKNFMNVERHIFCAPKRPQYGYVLGNLLRAGMYEWRGLWMVRVLLLGEMENVNGPLH